MTETSAPSPANPLTALALLSAVKVLFAAVPAFAARTAQVRKDPCVDQILTARDGHAARVPKRDIVHAEQFCRQQSNTLSASHSEWATP